MMVSPLGRFILWLHDRAVEAGRVPTMTDDALALLEGLTSGERKEYPTSTYLAGLELHDGRPHSEDARRIQRAALAHTASLALLLRNVDDAGYTPINVRGLLGRFFWRLKSAAVSSEEHCTYVDLVSAINRATERTRGVAWLLVAGYGPQEIGAAMGTNGSRRIGRAMTELAKILEGRYYGTTAGRPGGDHSG